MLGDPAVVLSSSLRAVSPEVTLARAKARARTLGITRVTDVTRLDRVGLPVYASIRPGAARGSLCVNAGKGLRPIEAEVGAYMEAVEMAMAEPGRSRLRVLRRTARDVLDGRSRPDAILDLCPKMGRVVTLDAPLDCVVVRDVSSGARALLPAELVFLPYVPSARFRPLFGSSSNGLSSGNTLDEATVHGLAEVIERDITSFQAVRDTSLPVDLDTLAGEASSVADAVRASGLELYVRNAQNAFGLPYFFAVINDPDALAPHLLNGGFGCHPHRGVAFVRAVAEAAQSRLSFIHGARDDLDDTHARYRTWSREEKRALVQRVVRRAAGGRRVAFGDIEDHAGSVATIAHAKAFLLARLAACGLRRAYRATFTSARDDLQVVKIVVPGLEMFTGRTPRIGRRLREHARAS